LVSEGQHEREGAAETIVRRLNGQVTVIEHDRLSRASLRAFLGRGQGYFKRALRWVLDAHERGFDAVVILVDHDGHPERVREFDDAQVNQSIPFRRALGVAIRTFDAWMLADEHALSAVLGYTVTRQPNPENVRDPKQKCVGLLSNCSQAMSQREMYAATAAGADLDVVAERCPRGFAVFAGRVRNLV
jgi:hypothetical protein